MPLTDDNALVLSKKDSWKIFDEIYRKYDPLNRILSWGMDLRWRRGLARYLPERRNLKVLDVATGTGDVPVAILSATDRVESIHGIDLSDKMLAMARKKIAAHHLEGQVTLGQGDAMNLSFPANSFDVATSCFGIRNMPDPKKMLTEMYRVLKPEGRILILEFSIPKSHWIRFLDLTYLRHVVPFVGFLLSGHYRAYRYLNQSIESFPSGEAFLGLLAQAGFKNLDHHPLWFGSATIYQGDK